MDFDAGSSPRTWGTRRYPVSAFAMERFIPTYMGNACTCISTTSVRAVHPHVHGERASIDAAHWLLGGSSPRTWGTLLHLTQLCHRYRFIPTYMGNAPSAHGRALPVQVHPHVHGERQVGSSRTGSAVGSSPRTWGTLETHANRAPHDRFIPTYMGNALHLEQHGLVQPVHPHVHGERRTMGDVI